MKTVGIVAEYNPFHNGHKYHIEEAKRLSNAERAVIVMSGSFVQRGEPACADKFKRAGWAIENGADAVIELPDVFAVSCAERFASGAVRILSGLGTVDSICFGSETGDLNTLLSAANASAEGTAFSEMMRAGAPYPAAMAGAMGLSLSPNDILGIEYIRAVKKICPSMAIIAVKREGSGYADTDLKEGFSSAGAIRRVLDRYSETAKLSASEFDLLQTTLPRKVLDEISELIKRGCFPATFSGCSDAIMYRLRCMDADEILRLPEISEGLENLFYKHCRDSSDVDEMLYKVKSKRYTMARLKRICICALLGIDRELQDEAANSDDALYARVLAVRKGSEDILSEMKERSRLPLIIQSSDREALPPPASRIEAVSSLAHGLRSIGQPYDKAFVPDISNRLIVR